VAKRPKQGWMVGIRAWCRLCAIAAPILLLIGPEEGPSGIDHASFS
jgi:hypothetical protein